MRAIWINNILYKHQDKVMNHYNLESDEKDKKRRGYEQVSLF